jgi:hypothetical protein
MIVARQFLEECYKLCDSEIRKPLVSAYHDKAVFSIRST